MYTLNQLASRLNTEARYIGREIREGRLRAEKVKNRYQIKDNEVERFEKWWIENRRARDVQPFRDYTCVNYESCLKLAARKNERFACEDCREYEKRDTYESI